MARRRAGAGDECTPADAKAFIEEEWSKEGVSVMGVGNEHVQLMLPAIFADVCAQQPAVGASV